MKDNAQEIIHIHFTESTEVFRYPPREPLTVTVELRRRPFWGWLWSLPRTIAGHYALVGRYYDAPWYLRAWTAFKLSWSAASIGSRKPR